MSEVLPRVEGDSSTSTPTSSPSKKRALEEIDPDRDVPPKKKQRVNEEEEEAEDDDEIDDEKNQEEKEHMLKLAKSEFIDASKTAESFRNYKDSKRQLQVEAFYKEQHTKMTYEFVMGKREQHLKFDKCVMTVWDMIKYLNNVVDDSDPDTDLSQLEHAIQTAEAARKAYPDEAKYDWLHVTAFVHDLGKILAVTDADMKLTGDPQWCVVGDTFPVGCEFRKESNVFSKYFELNPDFKNPKYKTKLGIYKEKCGLDNVIMSWGHDEYMYQIAKAQSKLPEEGLAIIRYHSFYPWHNHSDYMYLCNEKDMESLKWVRLFQKCDLYSKSQECPSIDKVRDYYQSKINKYFPDPVRW